MSDSPFAEINEFVPNPNQGHCDVAADSKADIESDWTSSANTTLNTIPESQVNVSFLNLKLAENLYNVRTIMKMCNQRTLTVPGITRYL